MSLECMGKHCIVSSLPLLLQKQLAKCLFSRHLLKYQLILLSKYRKKWTVLYIFEEHAPDKFDLYGDVHTLLFIILNIKKNVFLYSNVFFKTKSKDYPRFFL